MTKGSGGFEQSTTKRNPAERPSHSKQQMDDVRPDQHRRSPTPSLLRPLDRYFIRLQRHDAPRQRTPLRKRAEAILVQHPPQFRVRAVRRGQKIERNQLAEAAPREERHRIRVQVDRARTVLHDVLDAEYLVRVLQGCVGGRFDRPCGTWQPEMSLPCVRASSSSVSRRVYDGRERRTDVSVPLVPHVIPQPGIRFRREIVCVRRGQVREDRENQIDVDRCVAEILREERSPRAQRRRGGRGRTGVSGRWRGCGWPRRRWRWRRRMLSRGRRRRGRRWTRRVGSR
ncbi:unnamed protein product [Mycena citricolor]|uniref:Uncharacterized protein n=1 Tax=Mycena citricolor TaxID=2018698 RepID=A0AAD2HJ65_9AGAR|nr:unnamed protein product [Mycena citricolor]